jgi:hypothetical protein
VDVDIDALTRLLTGLVAVLLTLLVFSRLLGDNPAYRTAQYLFVGVSLGYALVIIYHQVVRPAFIGMLSDTGDPIRLSLRLAPWLIGLLLLTRLGRQQSVSWLANMPLALLFGVGAALTVGGALFGTLLPQILDTVRPIGNEPLQLISMSLLLIGVILTLSFFYFTVPRTGVRGRTVALGARMGRWILMIAFGFFFAGGLLTYLSALGARLEFILGWLRAPMG